MQTRVGGALPIGEDSPQPPLQFLLCWLVRRPRRSPPTYAVESAYPPTPDMGPDIADGSFVPTTDMHRSKRQHYSITWSAMEITPGGTSMPSAFAVLRLITNSNLVGCTTGRSAGFSPLRILP